jgi:hypothetical protein
MTCKSWNKSNTRLVPQLSEAKMIVTNFTPEDLKRLPLRAIAALAARCARRVERQALLPDDHPEKERRRIAVAGAIRLAEDFAMGSPCTSLESVIRGIEASRTNAEAGFVSDIAMGAVVQAARAAAAALRVPQLRAEPEESHMFGAAKPNPFPHLADVTADLAAREAFTAAMETAAATGHANDFIHAGLGDYEKLLRLDLGNYPEAGKPIDPSSKGPLGPLWPGEPSR